MITYINHTGQRAPHPVILTIPEFQYETPYHTDAFSRIFGSLPEVVERVALEPTLVVDKRKMKSTSHARSQLIIRVMEQRAKVLVDIMKLLQHGPMSGSAIAKAVGYARTGIIEPLRILRDQGKVINTGYSRSNKWSVCDAD